MKVNTISNLSFKSITLKRISLAEIAPKYDALQELSESENMDLYISKVKENRFLPNIDLYNVRAEKNTKNPFEYSSGYCVALPTKESDNEEKAEEIYNAALTAIDKAKSQIKKRKEGE